MKVSAPAVPKTRTAPARSRNGTPTPTINGGTDGQSIDLRALLNALQAVADGDFSRPLAGRLDRPRRQDRRLGSTTSSPRTRRWREELARVGQVVGREGKTRQRMRFARSGGAWGEMQVSFNTLIDDLVRPTTEVTRAVTAVAQGNLLQTVRLDVEGRPLEGEFLRSATIVNTMIKQLCVFTSEVTRVAREVGTDGKLGGQAQVPEVSGVWKDLTESVNLMASNLTAQVRNISEVTIAVASGDLSRKITVDVRGEILQLKEAINTMVDQLRSFASEVTRVAREVGTDGRLGGQAVVPGVAGTWKDLTDNVNLLAANLTTQVRNIAEVTTAVARGDLSRKITVDVSGEVLELKNTINTMVDQLNAFASEVTRVAREVGTEGKLGGQAQVPGVGGTWKDLTDNVNFMASNLTGQVRNIAEVATAIAERRPVEEDHGERERRDPAAQGNAQHDGRPAECVRVRSLARGARSGHGGPARRAGAWCPGVGGHVEGPDRQRESARGEPDHAGAQHRRGDHGRGARRPVAQDHRRRERRGAGAQEHDQHDGRPAERVRVGSHARRARGGHRRQARRPGAGARRGGHVEGPDRQRQLDGEQPDGAGAQHRRSGHGRRARRPVAQDRRSTSRARSSRSRTRSTRWSTS